MLVMFQWRYLLSFWSWKTSLYPLTKIAYAQQTITDCNMTMSHPKVLEREWH